MVGGKGGHVAILNFAKRESAERYSAMFSYMTDEELIDKVFCFGRESNFERFLLSPEREELRGLKAGVLARLRNKNKPR
jgi:hypothetical protein